MSKEQKEKDDIHRGVDFENCGTSAVQKMAGEDRGKAARIQQQRAQARCTATVAAPYRGNLVQDSGWEGSRRGLCGEFCSDRVRTIFVFNFPGDVAYMHREIGKHAT